jgi:D-lyxose ketol-isomerase
MRSASDFMYSKGFLLPKFAFWGPNDWGEKGLEVENIIKQQLGWDITDFGSGDFYAQGLILFTIRNGVFKEAEIDNHAKAYGEKIMVVQEEQVTPIHFHFKKTEDIINRSGGTLAIQLWKSTGDEKLSDEDVEVAVDGITVRCPAGGTIELSPGESVCLIHHMYHQFWGKKGNGPVLVGEISRACDEYTDNRFLNQVGRFADIVEDEDPYYLLFDDYQRFYPQYKTVKA